MKKILIVVDDQKIGGVSVLLNDILNKIERKNKQIDIMVLHNNGDYFDSLANDINIIYGTEFFDTVDLCLSEVLKTKNIKLILKKLKLILLMKTGLIKNKIIKERKKCVKKHYDIEIAFKDGFSTVFTAYGDSTKKYNWIHADYYNCIPTNHYKKLYKDVFLKYNKTIAISDTVKKNFKRIHNVKKIEVIHNLIDAEKIVQLADKVKIEKDIDKINFISVGRIISMKGYDRLIQVFAKLNKEKLLTDVKLRIVGDGPDLNLLKSLIQKNDLTDVINLEGLKKNPFPYIKNSDCFIMSSISESFGLVVLESMILGTPVISTKVASIHEIINKNYGMIVENSFDGLYNGIKRIIIQKQLLKKYKTNLKNYSYPTNGIITKIENLLDE